MRRPLPITGWRPETLRRLADYHPSRAHEAIADDPDISLGEETEVAEHLAWWVHDGAEVIEVGVDAGRHLARAIRPPIEVACALEERSTLISMPSGRGAHIVRPVGDAVLLTMWVLQADGSWGGPATGVERVTPLSVAMRTYETARSADATPGEHDILPIILGALIASRRIRLLPAEPPRKRNRRRGRGQPEHDIARRLLLDEDTLTAWERARAAPPEATPERAAREQSADGTVARIHHVRAFHRRVWVREPGADEEVVATREGTGGALHQVWRPVAPHVRGSGSLRTRRARLVTGPEDLA